MKNLLIATLLTFSLTHGSTSFSEETSRRSRVPNHDSNSDFSPLHLAAMQGDLDLVKRLLDEGQSPNQKQKKFGGTPLQYAVAHGRVDVALALLASGAHIDAADNFGRTPLDVGRHERSNGVCRTVDHL